MGLLPEYHSEDEGWGIPVARRFLGDPDLSWHIINSVVGDEFDITMCQEMLVDHASTIPMQLMWPGGGEWPVKVVPIAVNTVQHPLPSPRRCLALGRSVGRALDSYASDQRILVVGTGGLSHQLDGTRAGFVNKTFDKMSMDKLIDDPDALAKYSTHMLIKEAGAQGVELLNWLAMRGALTGEVSQLHRNYHVPISNTAAATQVLMNGNAKRKAA